MVGMNRNAHRQHLVNIRAGDTFLSLLPPPCGLQMGSHGLILIDPGISLGCTSPLCPHSMNKSWSPNAGPTLMQFNKPLMGTCCMPGALTVSERTLYSQVWWERYMDNASLRIRDRRRGRRQRGARKWHSFRDRPGFKPWLHH